MIAWLLVGMAVPWLAASALVRRCDAGAGNDAATAWLHGLLALGLALGLSSCSYFLVLLSCGNRRGRARSGILHYRDPRICRAGAGLPAGARGRSVGAGKSLREVRCASSSGKTQNVLKGSAPRQPNRSSLDRFTHPTSGLRRRADFRDLRHRRHVCRRAARRLGRMNIWTMRARFLFRSGQQWRNAFARSSSTPITLCC